MALIEREMWLRLLDIAMGRKSPEEAIDTFFASSTAIQYLRPALELDEESKKGLCEFSCALPRSLSLQRSLSLPRKPPPATNQ